MKTKLGGAGAVWQHIPAQTVRLVIEAYCQQFPPTPDQLKALLAEHDYLVVDVPSHYLDTPRTDHCERLVYLPQPFSQDQYRMLLHETAEVLLRLPVAPEFRFVPTLRDEFHEVALLVEGLAL